MAGVQKARAANDSTDNAASRRLDGGRTTLVGIQALENQVQQLLGGGGLLTDRSASSSDRITPDAGLSVRSRPCTPLLPSPSQDPGGAAGHSEKPSTAITTPVAPPADVDPIARQMLSAESAETLLERFKTALTPHFPFVIVPPHVSLEAMRQEKPFLLLSILAAASYEDVALQRRLGRQVQHCIAGKLIYGDTISLEALQGLLLAIGIIVDLRLDRKPDSRPWKTRIDLTKVTEPKEFLNLDEQRAVAGCFYLCSTVSTLLQKLSNDLFLRKGSLHIEECCQSLQQQKQYPTNLVEKADASNLTSCPTSRSAHVAQLRVRLETIKDSLPFTLTESPMLMTHWNTAMVYLCHTDVCTESALNALPTGETWPHWRVEALGTGLIAAKSTLSFFLSLPLGCEMYFNNSEWIQLGFVMTYSARLATLSSQTSIHQETLHLRRFLGMSDMLKDVASRLRSLSSSRMDDDGDSDVFNHYQQRVERLQAWFDTQSDRVPAVTVQPSPLAAHTATFGNGRDNLHYQECIGNEPLPWNAGHEPRSREMPAISMADRWQTHRPLDLSMGEDWFPPGPMDLANFGQYFAFDSDTM
ncbi:uncharacterized protein MYCGRDRAFT_91197 [Zymoseptoria tritici IPO323]|uniref:Transcription factor domain-containing protein n=1 Tax=Zymoseptoria tritici (strain CBS 115943 / IPO323) TaxID=336722 RepID=F9X4Q2_ZYMTI|nr:uncharacterized protein MYCGRDRAFT_91197 [Zymoseptoria tritici IPO323]EGP90158.1 hypothetical protein MYCGRDRAFT_91197 [Zymoseptoria tritici IPO323]